MYRKEIIKLKSDQYIGEFYKQDKLGRWRKIFQIGNAGVAHHVTNLLSKLGFKIIYEYEEIEEIEI